MKKIVFILAIAFTFITCKKEKNFVTFSGKIANKNGDKITLSKDRKAVKTFTVDENGMFSDTINNVEKGYYRLNDGKESSGIYLQNGYNINLTLDTKEFDETIKYTGNGSDVNNYLASKALLKEKVEPKDLYILNEKEFLVKAATINKELNDKLNSVKDVDFVSIERKSLQFENAGSVSMYEGYHGYLTKNREFKVSDTFPDPFKGIATDNDDDFKNIPAYKNVVMSSFQKKVSEIMKKDSVSYQVAAINSIKTIKGEHIKNGLLNDLGYEVSSRNKDAAALYKEIMALSTDDDFKKSLTKQFKDIKKTAKGMVSPTFVNYENHKGGTTSLEDLKGKFVYVDVWATWCGPCKAEIPFLKKVEKAYHGKNIHFLSVSIDKKKDHEAWVKMVKEMELGGIQLFADNDWNSKFVTDYGIKGIPRFILIDPAGKIVSASAPRPSSPALIKLFDENGI